ncbi:MAG TPA: PA14 domain-containing protein [Thermoanaerobaculia bacterium]|nr:PA14 domain-containing protein [Thermoanaerobaculia bacterium]
MKRVYLLFLLPATAFAQGFGGDYYRGWNCNTLPASIVMSRIDSSIDFQESSWDWPDGGAPGAMVGRWSGVYTAPQAGEYVFQLLHDDSASLSIDGAIEVAGYGSGGSMRSDSGTVTLTAGPHVLEVCYANVSGTAQRLQLTYRPPDAAAFALLSGAAVRADVAPSPGSGFINFDDIDAGVVLGTQLGDRGVTFDVTPVGSSGFYRSRPRVEVPVHGTASVPKLLRNGSRDALEGQDWSSGIPLTIRFNRPMSYVSVSVGTDQRPLDPRPRGVLSAYDSTGRLVGSNLLSQVTNTTTAPMRVLRGTADIAFVTLDFGDDFHDERIDSLRFEAFRATTIPPDLTAPAIEFVDLVDGQDLFAPSFAPITIRVRENTGSVTTASVQANGAAFPLYREASTALGCVAPRCSQWTGSVRLVNGRQTITAFAADAASNTGTASLNVNFSSGTLILVSDHGGRAVADAELWVNRRLHPTRTGSAGQLTIFPPLAAGTQLVARKRVHEQNTYRDNHDAGSTQNWNYRVYMTSVTINNDGSQSIHSIVDPSLPQRLQVVKSNVLIGAHLTVSLGFDANTANYNLVKEKIDQMSDALYNATDGQLFIEQVELMDHARDWDWVDLQIFASNSLRAFVSWPVGNFLGENLFSRSRMHLPWTEPGLAFAHEFGHYGLELFDEYQDDHPDTRCTRRAVGSVEDAGVFAGGQPGSSCLMDDHLASPKLCSGHAANPHVHGTPQGDEPCFSRFARRFAQSGLILRTPDSRGAIPAATILRPVDGWRPRYTIIGNSDEARLCPQPVTVRLPRGRVPVYLSSSSGFIRQGLTDAMGDITLVGAHEGDTIHANFSAESGEDFHTHLDRPSYTVVFMQGRISREQCFP